MDIELNHLEALSKIYKHIALQIHPDHGGSLSEMQELNNAYEFLRSKLSSTSTKVLISTFDFPYPNLEFRIGDFVKITQNNTSYIAEIDSIIQVKNKFNFKLKIGDKKSSIFRNNLNCSEDINFYLYRSRWD